MGNPTATQTALSLIPTITVAIVVFIAIYTMDLLQKKQPTNNKQPKPPNKKTLKKSAIIGIIVIVGAAVAVFLLKRK